MLGPSQDHPPDPAAAPLQHMPEPPLPDCLRFESRFESGNLAKVIRITEAYYEIYLRPDYYTSKHCQWFYFQVSQTLEYFFRFCLTDSFDAFIFFNEQIKLKQIHFCYRGFLSFVFNSAQKMALRVIHVVIS